MEDVKTAELLPCPFCGGEGAGVSLLPPTCTKATPYNDADRAYPIARCGGCFAEAAGDNWDESRQTAIAAWNRRAAAPAPLPGGLDGSSSLKGEDTHRVSADVWADLERLARQGLAAEDARDVQGLADTDQALWSDLTYSRLLELVTAARAGSVGIGAADEPKTPTEQAEGAVVGWPEKWSGDCTVGNFIANLSSLPPEMPLYTAYHIPLDEGSMLKVKRPTLSRERVEGTNIKTGDESVPYSAVIWTQPRDQYGHATPASVSPGTEGGQ